MTPDPLRGGSVFDIRTGRLGTGGTLAEKVFQFGLGCKLDATVPSDRLSNSLDALVAAGKRPGRDVAVTLNRVPTGFYAAHVGFVFTDVMGSDHCLAAPMRNRSSTKPV
jgi:hypothetical protein